MKTPNEVGTAFLDGLIEGPVPLFKDGEALLHQWEAAARAAGLPFHLTVDGARFNLLADTEPFAVDDLTDIQQTVKDALESLQKIFPEDLRGHLFSTLRSTENRELTQLQTVYLITSKGVQTRERKVERREEERPTFSLRQFLPHIVLGVVLLFVFLVAAYVLGFNPIRELRQLWASVVSVDPEQIVTDDTLVRRYVVLKKLALDEKKASLLFSLERAADYPPDMAAYRAEENRIKQEGSLEELVVLHRTILTGTLRAVYLDKKGETLVERLLDVRGLLKEEKTQVTIPIGPNRKIATVILKY